MKKLNLTHLGLAVWSLLAVGCGTDNDGGVSYEAAQQNYTAKANIADGGDCPAPHKSGDQFSEFADNPFVKTSLQPVSTFSVDADGASLPLCAAISHRAMRSTRRACA